MDKRTLRSKKSKPRNARPYDRQNQGIFGKVCSTVKGLLAPSWLINNVSQWMGSNSGQEEPTDVEEETVREDNDIVSQSHGGKRRRLRLEEEDHHNLPSIQSSSTQTWTDSAPTQTFYQSVSAPQSSLLQAKEPLTVMNGDDHSENSEGSASTSGCSSLVSSNNRLVESPFQNRRAGIKRHIQEPYRNEADTSKSRFSDANNSNRSLWSSNYNSPSNRFQRRLPTISNTNQPNFNLSSFVGPSKLNNSMDSKVTSPFYEGKTAFGGASASKRMPPSVAPYQADRTLRNQIKVREQPSGDSLEGMSSAAKRILRTLEKMSTPVADAKKIPNTNTSPVDLSLYLTPPKSRRNSQFTPSISKGPPIANINTIVKQSTLKNYRFTRVQNTVPISPVSPAEQKASCLEILQPSISEANVQKSGGGKIRSKRHQQHISTNNTADELPEETSLPNVPLPISSLPVINFWQKTGKTTPSVLSPKDFTFSKPIEHDLAINSVIAAPDVSPSIPYDSKSDQHPDVSLKPFVFSSPIEHELPNNVRLSSVFTSSPVSTTASTTVTTPLANWECSSCWVRNPSYKAACMSCETPKKIGSGFKKAEVKPQDSSAAPKMTASPDSVFLGTKNTQSLSSKSISSSSNSSSPKWECGSCWVRNPEKESKCVACEAPRPSKETSKGATTIPKLSAPTQSTSATWECSSCWIRNSDKESKCLACEAARPTTQSRAGATLAATSIPTSTWECSSCWIRNPVKETKCMACETQRSSKETNTGLSHTLSNPSSSKTSATWECTSCWVRNPAKEKKCVACETLHPDKETAAPAFKVGNGFKFSSPVQSSPIAFKFGNCVCTIQSTSTTSTFNFGTANTSSETTTTASDFKLSVPETTGFKFGGTSVMTTMNSGFPFGGPASSSSTATNKASETLPATSMPSSVSGSEIPAIEITVEAKLPSSTVGETSEPNSSSSTVSKVPKFWECDSCWVRNPAKETKCLSCEAPHSEKEAASGVATLNSTPTTSAFKFNPVSISSETITVNSGFKFGTSSSAPEVNTTVPGFKFGAADTTPVTTTVPAFKFGVVASSNSTASETNTTGTNFKFGAVGNTAETTTTSSNFKFGSVSSTAETTTASSNFKFGVATTALATTTIPSFKFGVPSSTATSTFFSTPAPTISSKTSDVPPAAALSTSSGFKIPTTEIGSTAVKLPEPGSSNLTTTASPFLTNAAFKFGAASSASEAPSATPVFKFGVSSVAPLTTASGSGFKFGAPASTASSFFSNATSKSTSNVAATITSQATAAPAISLSSGFRMPSTEVGSTGGKQTEQSSSSTPFASSSQSGGFLFKGPEKPPNTSTPAGGFVFGAPKTEAQTAAATPFVFGSSVPASNSSAFSAFQPSQPANTAFQFGSQPAGSGTSAAFGSSGNFAFPKSEANPVSGLQNTAPSAFGSSGNFALAPKTETTPSQISSSASPAMPFGSSNSTFSFGSKSENAAPQNPTPFGSAVFGNALAPPFGTSDKPASGGFTFGAPSGVFQFGAAGSEKKVAAPNSGFAFGTPENNNFSSGFTMSTPPSFNFGATSTPTAAGPFQFAASAPESASSQTAPRKYRKAVRRVRKE